MDRTERRAVADATLFVSDVAGYTAAYQFGIVHFENGSYRPHLGTRLPVRIHRW